MADFGELVIGTPPKGTFFSGTTSFWRMVRKNRSRVWGLAYLKESKTNKKLSHPTGWQNDVYGEQKPQKGAQYNFACRMPFTTNHACRFRWRSVKGFGVARGRILSFFIDLLRCHYNTVALPIDSSTSDDCTIAESVAALVILSCNLYSIDNYIGDGSGGGASCRCGGEQCRMYWLCGGTSRGFTGTAVPCLSATD